MKHYTLTAEQMQQVREAVSGTLDQPETPEAYAAMMERLTDALALLDAAMQAPEATAGGDVREAYKARRRMMSEDLTEAELRELENICHPVDDALDAQHAALAAAPKPEKCSHGCVDGKLTPATLRTPQLCALEKGPDGRWHNADCPIHGTKPEAPTELCKVCGEVIRPREMMCMDCGASLHDACVCAHDRDCPGSNHPFTPTDATPKDEETGR